MTMKRIIKKTCYIILKLIHTIRWFLEILLKTDLKNHVIWDDKRCVINILANGPSLIEDIKKINFEEGDCSVVNFFYKSPYFFKIKPRFYVIADPFFFESEDSIKPIIDNVTWSMKLVIPYYAWKKYKILHNIPNKKIEVVPLHCINYSGFECIRHWAYRHGFATPKTQNVLVASIYNAVNSGYKEIRLYGADHSWTQTLGVNEMNQVCAIDSHFYDKEKVKYLPYNCMKMHELLRAFAFMFESYHYLRNYADYRGCKVINCTKGSFIDAFEREK